jgi:S1-C subfamily serine protease
MGHEHDYEPGEPILVDPYAPKPSAVGPVDRPAVARAPGEPAAPRSRRPGGGSGRWALRLAAGALLVAVVAVLGWRLGSRRALTHPAQTPSAVPSLAPTASRGPLLELEQRTVDIFHTASPSVVYITQLSVQEDPFSRDALAVPRGTGSGFVWDAKGHIVTNFHVIAGGNAARVTLSDGSVWPAQLVGEAPDKDVAVLHIDAPLDKLPPLPIGTSDDLVVGQMVFAIGNPFGLDHTLSTGVISGLNREIKALTGHPIQGVVQTDAAINPGNSGGPLLDSSGRLVGMNTAIFSPSGASAGIGFAVPIDSLNRVVTQLIAFGKLVRPGLGIQIAEPELGQRLRVDGVLVLGVVAGSPAEQAGIQPTRRHSLTGAIELGDVIVAVDGEPVHRPVDLFRQLDRKSVGDTVKITVTRGKDRRDLSVALAPLAE